MVKGKICASAILLIIGIELLVVSIVLFAVGGKLIDSTVKKECELHQGTKIYEAWRNPPLPLKISFYFFNITNQTFLDGTATPVVQQCGPFVYQEVRKKEDVLTHDNGTISYRETREYTFDESASVGPNSTKITTMNVVYMTFMNYFQTATVNPDIKQLILDVINVTKVQPVMEHTVHELLWGYVDDVLSNLPGVSPIASIFNASVGEAGLNTFLINNGIDLNKNESDRLKKAGNIEGYNGKSSLPYWTNEYANMINGTDSTIWHEGATKDDQVYIYSPDLCRSLKLQYTETRDNTFGTETLRFTLPAEVFANTPDNEGFCLNTTDIIHNTTGIECLPDGLMSLKSCLKPSGNPALMLVPLPIIASNPHFLGAADSVRDAVHGLQPDPTIHRSFMDVEPITGTVMNGSRRMQINLNVVNSSDMEAIAKLKPFVYPLLWLDEHAEIDQKNSDDFRSSVTSPIKLLKIGRAVLLAFGIVLIVIAIVLILISCFKDNSSDEKIMRAKSSDDKVAMISR